MKKTTINPIQKNGQLHVSYRTPIAQRAEQALTELGYIKQPNGEMALRLKDINGHTVHVYLRVSVGLNKTFQPNKPKNAKTVIDVSDLF